MTPICNDANSASAIPVPAEQSRRSFLRAAAAAGLTGLGATLLLPKTARADAAASPDSAQTIMNIARTAEQLSVTFHINAIAHADDLGLFDEELDWIIAAGIHEQIHELFLAENGAQSLASTFSFPHGPDTFTNRIFFIETQQQLEGQFDTAYYAAAQEFAQLGLPEMSRISAQIAAVEEGHRIVGRLIGGYGLIDNRAFGPVLTPSVGAVPEIVAKAGYMSPVSGNSYEYKPIDFGAPRYARVYDRITFKTPYALD